MKDDALSLAFRTGLPFVGLRDHEHDPELDRFIPPDAARAARVVVLSAGAGHLRLAVADPEADLTALTPYVGDRRVELAVAADDEVEAILGPPPPPPAPRATAQPLDLIEQLPAEPADGEPEQPQPEPVAAEPEAATDGEPLAVAGEAEASEPVAAEPAAAGPSEGEPLATAAAPSESEPLATAAEPGEVPSWLEPPRRGRKVVVVLTVLLLLLVVAAGAATAYLLTR